MTLSDTFLKDLEDDFISALRAFHETDVPYTRRAVVRAFGAAVEGETYFLKQHCLARIASTPAFYTPGEAAMLLEQNYNLDKDGSVVARPQFLRPAENFHFVLKAFAKDTLPDLDIREDHDGWQWFTSAIKIRNRVTHPKVSDDLSISDRDIGTVQRAFLWFRKTLTRVQVASGLLLHDHGDRLRTELTEAGLALARAEDPRIIPREQLQRWLEAIDATEIPPFP